MRDLACGLKAHGVIAMRRDARRGEKGVGNGQARECSLKLKCAECDMVRQREAGLGRRLRRV